MNRFTLRKFLFAGIFLQFMTICPSPAQVDQKAQQILKEVSQRYKSYKTISASFKLSILDQKTKKTDVQAGNISLRGNAYQFSMAGQQVISDGKTVWTYLKESNEVQISNVETGGDAISPTNIFTMYEKGFKQKYAGEKKEGNVAVHIIDLFPENTKKNYFKIQLTVNKSDKYVSAAKVFDKNGNIYTYTVLKFTPNATVTEDMFTFSPARFPGVEVVDLR